MYYILIRYFVIYLMCRQYIMLIQIKSNREAVSSFKNIKCLSHARFYTLFDM